MRYHHIWEDGGRIDCTVERTYIYNVLTCPWDDGGVADACLSLDESVILPLVVSSKDINGISPGISRSLCKITHMANTAWGGSSL